MIVAFLGPETSFTHQAAVKHFGDKADFVPKKSVQEVFESVEKKESEFGVVAVENSTEGSVSHTLDSFMDSDLRILAEIVLPIKHCLLSNSKLNEIQKVFAHSQAFAQCKKYLKKNLPNAEQVETFSNSLGAMLAAKEPLSAAIASELAGKTYGLKVIDKEINDEKNNQTRFFVIGEGSSKPTGNDKTTILFSTKNVPGALFNVLKILANNKINMTKIESRPSKKKIWEVVFFVEFEDHEKDAIIVQTLKEMKENCEFLKVLGSYHKKTDIID
jgi:chorismate mutase/prephenate dehydratase